MSGLGSANKVIVGNVQIFPEIFESTCHSASQFSRAYSLFLSRLGNFISVLIGSGKKEYAMSFESVISRQDVSSYCSISVSYMRDIVDVVDRSSHIEFFLQKMFPFILAINLGLSFYPIKGVIQCQI